jgi:hypothetical protein
MKAQSCFRDEAHSSGIAFFNKGKDSSDEAVPNSLACGRPSVEMPLFRIQG